MVPPKSYRLLIGANPKTGPWVKWGGRIFHCPPPWPRHWCKLIVITCDYAADKVDKTKKKGARRRRRASAKDGQFASGQTGQQRRRSLQLDTIVVVDSVMSRRRRSLDVTTYTMAIMNMVGSTRL